MDTSKHDYVPSPSTSQATDETSFEKILDSQFTAREKRLLQRLLKAKLSLKMLANTSVNLDKLDSDTLSELVQGMLKNQKVKPGERWTLKRKIAALSIFKRSPKSYRYMQTLMPLPSTKTLQRLLNNVPIQTGIHHNIINIMKNKAKDMDSMDRYCTLAFDMIVLKKMLIYNETADEVDGFVDYGLGESMGRQNDVADHALVFMVQGIRKKFKQPIAHYFVAGTAPTDKLVTIIKQVIEALSEAQFKVIATVCNHSPTNTGALNRLRNISGEPTDNNYFHCPGKIYIVYDVPHLFKSVRNMFLKGGIIKLNNHTAKWQHLIQAEEANRNFLNFPNITQTVVKPTNKTKTRVKYAAHALSNTMAAILKMMACRLSQHTKEEVLETAKVVEELDRLFDYTNGPASPKDVKKGTRENVHKKSNHTEKWDYYLKIMDSFEFVNSETLQPLKRVRCIKAFQITLKSLIDIWNVLKKKAGFKCLNLRQLNKDSLENLFGFIRQHSGTNKITCTNFTDALKAGIISGLLAPVKLSICEEDSNKVLLLYKDIIESQKNKHTGDDIH